MKNIVRELVNKHEISKYRLSKDLNVSWNTIHNWYRNIYTPIKKNQIKLERFLKKTLPLTLIIILSFTTIAFANEVDTTRCVLHHTETQDVSIEVIRKYHITVNGWKDVGYHFLIRENGDIEEGRPLTMMGAHTKGRNHWIGIALTGKDYFTVYQLSSLYKLLRRLKVEYVEPHYEDYACPGESLRDFIYTYNQGR